MKAPLIPPSLDVLIQRLKHYRVYAQSNAAPDADAIAAAIKAHALECVICAGAIVEGRPKALRFSDYYALVFGRDLDGRALKRKSA